MASYTENYALTKPTMAESADIRVINSNMDTVDDVMHSTQISLAPAYDMNETYNTGDVVMYELLMYECLEDEVTGAWDATKWQRTTAGEHGGGSDVEVTQIQTEGKAVASIAVDGVSTNILIPELKVYGEATGDLITIEDAMETPLEECKVTLEPQQAGTGDPSPENVRPISGWDECNVTVVGKNLLGGLPLANAIANAGGTLDTANKTVSFSHGNSQVNILDKVKLKENTRYTFVLTYSNTGDNNSLVLFYKTSENRYPIDLNNSSNTKTTIVYTTSAATIDKLVLSWILDASTKIYYEESGLFEGELTASDFEPYNGQTYTIQLGSTCYGGELDVKSGVLRVDRAMVDLGTLEWLKAATASNSYRFYTENLSRTIKAPIGLSDIGNLICSNYKALSFNTVNYNNKDGIYVHTNKTVGIYDSEKVSMNQSDFKTAMNGVQLVYELATPTEIQLTPTEVTLLRGINNLWSDGEMYVKYRRDIEMLLQRIADSLGGNA